MGLAGSNPFSQVLYILILESLISKLFPPFDQEERVLYSLCMHGSGAEEPEQADRKKKSGSRSPRDSGDRSEAVTPPVQGLVQLVRHLQSEVDKLKYAEHRRRELERAVKERKEAEAKLKEWFTNPRPE